jgi:hypothetical protein
MGVLTDHKVTGKEKPLPGRNPNGTWSHGIGTPVGKGTSDIMEDIYITTPLTDASISHNWYKQKPYSFVFTDRSGTASTFYLPISPSNLNISTHFATNIISTMYGTVEEHSEQRYYDITIAGTTGMSPRYYELQEDQFGTGSRAEYPIKSLFNGTTWGLFKRTEALAEAALNNASDIFGPDKPSAGIDLGKTGYIAFHNFYKFLLAYKKDTSGEISSIKRKGHPLKFVNYKDNNEYDVAIQGFQLSRDASNPMLYNYNLVMRAYNLRSADGTKIENDVADRREALGLDGVNNNSIFSKMANKARSAKNAAYVAIAAVKGAGS